MVPWELEENSWKIGEFVFMGCDWMLKVNDDFKHMRETDQHATVGFAKYGYSYMGIKPDLYLGDEKLRVIVFGSDPTTATTIDELWQCTPMAEPEILNKNPSGKRFNLLLEHQKRQFDASRQLFFLQDDKRTFLVSPVEQPPSVQQSFIGDNIDITLINSIDKTYYTRKEVTL
jgi:hypothetical protein